jgi:hypothetical protein
MSRQEGRERGGCWLGLLALPVLCCAGPSLLAAVGAGSVTAALGGATGSVLVAVAVVGAAVVLVAVVVLLRRRGAR